MLPTPRGSWDIPQVMDTEGQVCAAEEGQKLWGTELVMWGKVLSRKKDGEIMTWLHKLEVLLGFLT